MEFKRIFNMSWISLLWFVSVYSSAFGTRHAASVTNEHQDTMAAVDMGRFPIDLLTASTSAVEKGNPGNPPKMKLDEDKKTLSQQVADGKYGLIQKELFTNPVRRPGVLSYESNGDVPKDNVHNLGGLNKSDIWLAENHLLVLKGGVFPVLEALPEYSKPDWPPIDDYAAPRRPVKLSKHPKVPPPFPVQLTDGGPLQILGTNFTRTLNDSFFPPPYAVSPLEGYEPGNGPYLPPSDPNSPNATPGETPFPAPPYYAPVQGDNKPGEGLSPQFPFPINGGLPPFFDSLPPGSAILPPPNITDQYDEDDLSIYYPPPYSFYYQKDNTTQVPPGPLVPGIVLPPPPDFFSILKKPSSVTKPSTTEAPRMTRPTTTSTLPTTTAVYKTRKPSIIILKNATSKPPSRRTKPTYYKTAVPTYLPEVTSKKYQQQPLKNKTVSVTILRPVKTTKKPTVYIYDNDISNKPFAEYGPPPARHHSKISVTTTKIPLRAYYSTSSETDTNLVTRIPEKQPYTTRNVPQRHRTKPSSQFYYYDDAPITNSISTPYPVEQQSHYHLNLTNQYYSGRNEEPKRYNSDSVIHVQQTPIQPEYYYLPNKQYVTQRPRHRIIQQTPSNFKSHIVQLQEQIQSYQRPQKQYKQSVFDFNDQPRDVPPSQPIYQYQQQVQSPKPVYQYSFEVANYREQHERLQQMPHIEQHNHHQPKYRNSPKYSVQIEPAVEITTTESPIYQNTPAPIYYPENYQDNSQPVPPQRYYTNNLPEYNYQEQQKYSPVTPHPLADNSYKATPNPIYQPYYTKQDEQLFDDITKKYFTTFGKKLATSTTPIPAVESPSIHSDQRQVIYTPEENVRIRTNQQSYVPQSNIKANILVNYVNQRPTQNVRSEYIQFKQQQQQRQQQQQSYPQVTKQGPQFIPSYQNQPYQQQSDNSRQRVPQNNINVQTIRAISIPTRNTVGEGKPGSFISYELPGDDGAHFYFLTPQLTQKDDRGDIAYYYTQPSNSRIRRNSQTRGV